MERFLFLIKKKLQESSAALAAIDPGLLTKLGLALWGVALVVVAWLLVGYLVPEKQPQVDPPGATDETPNTDTPPPCVHVRVVDGVCVSTETEVDVPLVGVMVEYAFDAWPVAGLDKARVIYEAPVEGMISRFLAIFVLDDEVQMVGPVRSSRPYFLDWIEEFGGAMYMHVGGSPQALERIANNPKIFAMNEMTRGWFFWRSDDRSAPHNTFTASRLWQKAWTDYGEGKKLPLPLATDRLYGDREVCTGQCVTRIGVPVVGRLADWVYTSSTGRYARQDIQRGVKGTDAPLLVDTIIVQESNMRTIDTVLRREIDTVGEGKAIIFHSGLRFEGVWRKQSKEAQTTYATADGKPIVLRRGVRFVHIVPPGTVLTLEEKVN